ncbi:protein kinase [Achlya hypogyna]|uniref:Protein kinase n=1 Tax=Achlya hypogyna TaxID=1202772 RepID=A0A1V9YPH7_ACHHY|nr:protein kinase [Achlya hypogyna]
MPGSAMGTAEPAAVCSYSSRLPLEVTSVAVASTNGSIGAIDRTCAAVPTCTATTNSTLDLTCFTSPALGNLSQASLVDLRVNCASLDLTTAVLPSIDSLSIQHCKIGSLPQTLQWPESLQTLDFTATSLTALPPSLPLHLRSLTLNDNNISTASSSWTTLPTSLRHLSLQNCSLSELRDLDGTRLESLLLGHNPLLRTIANVTLTPYSLRTFSCDDCNLSSVVLDADSYAALNSLPPRSLHRRLTGYSVPRTVIDSSPAECDRHHAQRKPLWAPSTPPFFVCVLPRLDIRYTNLWSTIGVAVTGSALAALLLLLACAVRRHRRGLLEPRQSILGGQAMEALALVQLDGAALQLEARLARSDRADVWRGRYKGAPVAIKQLRTPTSAATQRFVDEIRLVAALDAPSIVAFIGAAWTTPSDLKCVLELCELGDLGAYLAATPEAACPWGIKTAVARAVLDALVYLHSLPLLHRDVRSQNVLLDAELRAKLGGVGVAFEDDVVVGGDADRWTAPEVLLGKAYTAAADVFAFGATWNRQVFMADVGMLLAEMSTHERPYAALATADVVAGVADGNLLPTFAPTCPAWAVDLGLSCLAHDPVHRPTALELLRTLESHDED